MAFKDLREFMEELESRGLLRRIKTEVDAELEITEITDRVSKMEGEKNVALLFENVKGYDMPVLMNAFGSMERMSIALGVESLDEIADDLRDFMRLPKISLANKMDLVTLIPKMRKAVNFPKYVKKAPCQEVVEMDNPSLDILPILKCWPEDGGPFITLPLVFTKNPETGKRNVGMYRLQKYDKNTTGMHWHIHKNGAENFRAAQEQGKDRIEVAVAIGTDPVLTYAATAPLPTIRAIILWRTITPCFTSPASRTARIRFIRRRSSASRRWRTASSRRRRSASSCRSCSRWCPRSSTSICRLKACSMTAASSPSRRRTRCRRAASCTRSGAWGR